MKKKLGKISRLEFGVEIKQLSFEYFFFVFQATLIEFLLLRRNSKGNIIEVCKQGMRIDKHGLFCSYFQYIHGSVFRKKCSSILSHCRFYCTVVECCRSLLFIELLDILWFIAIMVTIHGYDKLL